MIIILIVRHRAGLRYALGLGRHISVHILLHTLGIEHPSGLTTAIDLKDLSSCAPFLIAYQFHLRIFRPCLRTITCAIDISPGHTICMMLLLDRHIDIDSAKDGTALLVVSTVDSTLHQRVTHRLGGFFSSLGIRLLFSSDRIVYQTGVFTMVFHISLIDIARQQGLCTVCATEDTTDSDGGTNRNIDDRATGNTFLVAGTVGSADGTTGKVDDGRGLVLVSIGTQRLVHTDTTPCSGTEHLKIFILSTKSSRNIDEHIAAVLHDVTVFLARIALTGTIDFTNLVVTVDIFLVVSSRTEIDNGIIEAGLGEQGIPLSIL